MRGGVGWRWISGWRGHIVGSGALNAVGHVHPSHSLLQEALALNRLLVPLITKVLLYSRTNGHRAFVLIAVFGVRDTQKDKLLADLTQAPLVGEHQLALTCVRQNTLHLNAARLLAVRIVALCGVN